MKWEAALMSAVSENGENVLEKLQIVSAIKLIGGFRVSHVFPHFEEEAQASFGNRPELMTEGPYNRIDDKLEVFGGDHK